MLDYPLVDVIGLIRQHLDRNRRTPLQAAQESQTAQAAPVPHRNTEKVIYREATDDDWF